MDSEDPTGQGYTDLLFPSRPRTDPVRYLSPPSGPNSNFISLSRSVDILGIRRPMTVQQILGQGRPKSV